MSDDKASEEITEEDFNDALKELSYAFCDDMTSSRVASARAERIKDTIRIYLAQQIERGIREGWEERDRTLDDVSGKLRFTIDDYLKARKG